MSVARTSFILQDKRHYGSEYYLYVSTVNQDMLIGRWKLLYVRDSLLETNMAVETFSLSRFIVH